VQAAQWQEQLLVWPVVTARGMVLCPSCTCPLVDLGPRDPLYEMVVESSGSSEEIMRFPVEVDSPILIGRGSSVKGVNLAMDDGPFDSDLKMVSRQHLLIRIEEVSNGRRRMAVTDLDSRNGTRVERWTGTAFQQPRPLTPGHETVVGDSDRLILGTTIRLRLSGKRYVAAAGPTGPFALRPDPGSDVTVFR
jgi:hypothetical protein